MAIFKCKMCGGSLEIAEGMTVCECEYCGTQQTLPKNHDDVLANNFNRANNLRMKSEFDKAQEIYEKIVGNNPNESEAYWGIVLCKYGIEYVEDPATLKKIPTCHRTQLESVMTDVDYQSAIKNADAVQRGVYEREAAAIDKLQKDILAIVHNEQPFDVFICYKESDENGRRTPDSVIANDIYHQLTNEGFKVFYAAITLEDKLGQEYEPYIFAALSSAKVMLCIGTRPEYFNAVWVKNEWSRYLKLMKSDRSKLLIPCYKDMDAYDLPEEFSHLQAQDMGKVGFINDVIRGIKKVVTKDEAKQTVVKETVVQTANTTTAPLLKRASLFLEDRDWNSATEYCNKVLDIDPECSQAYFYMLLAELQLPSQKILELWAYENGISDSKHFKSAIRFADDEFKSKLQEINKQTIYNFAEKAFKEANNRSKCMAAKAVYEKVSDFKDSAEKIKQCDEKANEIDYADSLNAFERATDRNDCMAAKAGFEKIKDFKDSAKKMQECDEKANEIDYANALSDMQKARNEQGYNFALEKFAKLGNYKDSAEKVNECREKARESAKAAIYEEAAELFNSKESINSFKLDKVSRAKGKFEEIRGFRDSDEMIEKCDQKIKELNVQIEAERKAEEKKARKTKILSAVVIVMLLLGGIFGSIKYQQYDKQKRLENYNNAIKAYKNYNVEKASQLFEVVGSDYKRTQHYLDEIEEYNSFIEDLTDGDSVVNFNNTRWEIVESHNGVCKLFAVDGIKRMQMSEDATCIWGNSDIRKFLNKDYYNSFPYLIKHLIVTNNIETINADESRSTTEDYLYLPTRGWLDEHEFGYQRSGSWTRSVPTGKEESESDVFYIVSDYSISEKTYSFDKIGVNDNEAVRPIMVLQIQE